MTLLSLSQREVSIRLFNSLVCLNSQFPSNILFNHIGGDYRHSDKCHNLHKCSPFKSKDIIEPQLKSLIPKHGSQKCYSIRSHEKVRHLAYFLKSYHILNKGSVTTASLQHNFLRSLHTSCVLQSSSSSGLNQSFSNPLTNGEAKSQDISTSTTSNTEGNLGSENSSVLGHDSPGTPTLEPALVSDAAQNLDSTSTLLFPDFPTIHMAEVAIQTLHDSTGLPWWSSVILTAVIMRTLLITPLNVFSQHNAERLNSIRPQIEEIAKGLKVEVSMAMHQFKWDERKAKEEYNKNMKRHIKNLYIAHNCHPMKNVASFWLQLPLWLSVSYALRNMSLRAVSPDLDGHAACKDLSIEGVLWFPDLTVPDSTWILPIMMGCVTLFNIEMTQLNIGEVTKYRKCLTYFLRFVVVLFVPICSTMPSVMVLYWVTSGTLAAAQNILHEYSPFRRLVKLPYSPTESTNPFKALICKARLKYFGR